MNDDDDSRHENPSPNKQIKFASDGRSSRCVESGLGSGALRPTLQLLDRGRHRNFLRYLRV